MKTNVIEFDVTQEHIDEANQLSDLATRSRTCPIARAARQHFGESEGGS